MTGRKVQGGRESGKTKEEGRRDMVGVKREEVGRERGSRLDRLRRPTPDTGRQRAPRQRAVTVQSGSGSVPLGHQ